MMNKNAMAVYGRGWAFPPSFDLITGVRMVADEIDIHQSLRILFLTQPGERIMRPDFGCDLQSSVFENINEELLAKIKAQITDGIERTEPRVELLLVELEPHPDHPSRLKLQVLYQIRGSDLMQQLNGELDIGDANGVTLR
ncbi:GPW/gp25 family protein [Burkholderia ubonensis]|uniref:GPW/gp25 family protein n=1 Tax=Burkholderia ubonensis TaxID=101571 RepID=UPI00075F40C6|nr:GPW/gp25 family protein [Burkholderia ubonensis]KWN65852.1 hypothetical protein WM23_07640 [Burkholderia ubonensis]